MSLTSAPRLRQLPDILADLERRWSLKLRTPFVDGSSGCAWVAPVILKDNTHAVLKLGMPHMEGEQEIEGLRFWSGNPTVRLLEADDDLNAMLLERCEPGTSLREQPETEQDIVIAGLLRRLWRSLAGRNRFRPLCAITQLWSTEIMEQAAHWRDPGLVQQALNLFKHLSEPTQNSVLLATDLHAGNVLRAQREPWLVIDPKPFVGDPAYDATQHLLNCYARLYAEPDGTICRFADLLALDPERVRLWTFARVAAQSGVDWRNDRWYELAKRISV